MASPIYVFNKSTVVTDAEVKTMTDACHKFVPTLCHAWGYAVPAVHFAAKSTKVPAGGWVFNVVDTADVEGALAYHTEENDKVDGYVMAKTVLENGGVALYKDAQTSTVASALCHEIFEAIGDRYCNVWADDPSGNKQYSFENCDPVQDGIVTVTVDGHTVGLSNFILPSWFDTELVSGKVDYLGQLTAPFTITPGGYAVVRDLTNGKTDYVFGHAMTDAHRALKRHPATRAGRRHKRAHKK